MSDSTAENFLRDLGDLIARQAAEAKVAHSEAQSDAKQFMLGRLSAYHDIVSLMQQQAVAFGLDLRALALENIVPDRDLL